MVSSWVLRAPLEATVMGGERGLQCGTLQTSPTRWFVRSSVFGDFHMPVRANINMKDGVFLDKVPSYSGGRKDSLQVSPNRAFSASRLFQTDVTTT